MAKSIVDDDLWNEFHELVNMTSAELRDWLATEASDETAEEYPDQAGNPTSRTVPGSARQAANRSTTSIRHLAS